MRADGLKPSNLALNSLINAFGEDRRDADAFAVLKYMKENVSYQDLSPSYLPSPPPSFNLGSKYPHLYLQLQGMKPDVVTYTTVMKALIRVDKFDQVFYIIFCNGSFIINCGHPQQLLL